MKFISEVNLCLTPVDARDPGVVKRFAKASVGWVRYKPLLAYISDRSQYEATIESMRGTFERHGPSLSSYFGAAEFTRLLPELKRYARKVPEHYELFQRTKEAWTKALPWARAHPLETE